MGSRQQPEDNRELMRAWLINQLNSNSITGLEWHDGQRTCFRVPWIHGSRRCWNKVDGEVFMKWALHTGKYIEGRDAHDHKKWKANFRCAINSLPDVEELKEESSKKGTSAYRVYRLKEEKARRSKCRRFTGLHKGKGNKRKISESTRRSSSRFTRKNHTSEVKSQEAELNNQEMYQLDHRIPTPPRNIDMQYTEYSPASCSPSSECSSSLIQLPLGEMSYQPDSPESMDDSIIGDSRLQEQDDWYIETECEIETENNPEHGIIPEHEIVKTLALIDSGDSLPQIDSFFTSSFDSSGTNVTRLF